jgi:hypothetical protein
LIKAGSRPDSLIAETLGTSEEFEEGTSAGTGLEMFAGTELMPSWLIVVELCCVRPFCLGRFKRNAMTFPNPWNNGMGILVRWLSDGGPFVGQRCRRVKEGGQAGVIILIQINIRKP